MGGVAWPGWGPRGVLALLLNGRMKSAGEVAAWVAAAAAAAVAATDGGLGARMRCTERRNEQQA